MIYSKASRVIVVLSESCSTLLEQIQNTGYVDIVTLLTLEDDDWAATSNKKYSLIVNALDSGLRAKTFSKSPGE